MMLAAGLARDPSLSLRRKAALGLGMGYVACPVDLIPGVIPVLGQLDDLTALLLWLRTALNGCTHERAAVHLESVGLSTSALEADIRTVQVAAMWLVVSAADLATRPLRALLRRRRRPPALPEPATASRES
jgi:uncharacterized membrane protein YkvA (DUF1232 family)